MLTYTRFFLLSATFAIIAGAPAFAESAPRIPTEAFFSNPTFSSPRLSPDGKHIAVLYSKGDHQFVVARPASGGELKPLAELKDPETRLVWLEWANPDRLLLSATERNTRSVGVRGRITRLFGVDRKGGRLRWLGRRWPKRGQGQWEVQFQDQVVHWLPDDRNHVLISYHNPFDRTPSIKRLDVDDGRTSGRQRAIDKIDAWHVDPQGNVRAGEGRRRNRYTLFARVESDGRLRELQSHDVFADDGFEFAGFHQNPKRLFVFSEHEGRSALYEFDIEAGTLGPLVFAHPDADVGPVIFSKARNKVIGVAYLIDEPQVHYIDEEARQEHESIDHAIRSVHEHTTENRVVSTAADGSLMIVRTSSDIQPPVHYAYDRVKRVMTHLLDERPDIPIEHLVPMQRVSYTARDGLEIAAYLTIPKDTEAQQLPVIVLPHGGPWARDWKRYDPEVQLFANRGFAVFQMNFRGSTGYGSAFTERGYRQWGQAIQDDITDGVKWLIREGIADPGRIGIYGGSYGGYAAMMGLIRTPDLYRAGASYAGVMDIETLISDDRRYDWAYAWHKPMVGGELGDGARLERHSPVHRAGEIRVPVLLAHGADDERVHAKHSQRMARALRRSDKDVEYLEFEDEIHGFLLESNRIRFYERLVTFFEEHLVARPPEAARPAAQPQSPAE